MESSFQKIIAAIVAVLIIFIIPVYIAYEKIDDISYSLALKITQNFVDNVRDRGYISPEMYGDFIMKLTATGTIYDVEIGHVKKRYDPAIYIYTKGENGEKGNLKYILDYAKYSELDKIEINGVEYNNGNSYIEKAHTINKEIITDKQIVKKMFLNTGITKEEFFRECLTGNKDLYNSLGYINENSYIFSEGDQINVIVKNSSQTIASAFYSMLTANVSNEEIAKIYVNYGGTVKNDGADVDFEDNQSIYSDQGKLFKYKGTPEEVVLDKGTYEIKCWGADGGGTNGGKGAYVKAEFEVKDELTVYVYVGGAGTEDTLGETENGGYNGGGSSYNGFGGGGASDVRLYKGDWNDTVSLLSRIIVAAGGGGSSKVDASGISYKGGSGGNLYTGIDGTALNNSYKRNRS